jgi:hypothetical protein
MTLYIVKRKWKSHKTTPCKGYWLYRIYEDEYAVTDWVKWADYQEWKNYIILEDFEK